MNQQHTAQLGYWLKVVTLGVVLGFGIQFAQAWTNPSAPAPTGNVAGPVNTGIVDQVKNAGLGLVGNLVVGSAGAGKSICLNGNCITSWPGGASGGPVTGSVVGGCDGGVYREFSDGTYNLLPATCWGGARGGMFPVCPAGSTIRYTGHVYAPQQGTISAFICVKN